VTDTSSSLLNSLLGQTLLSFFSGLLRRCVSWTSDQFQAQAPSAILWWPVITALGIGVFFALPVVPPAKAGPVIALGAAAGWLAVKVRILRWSMTVVVCAALGFTATELRTQFVEAPVLAKETGPVWVEGRVISAEPVARGYRLTLDELIVQDLSQGATPERVRITVPKSHDAPSIGDGIEVRAVLRPPGRPVMPGGFDFQRYSFYRQLGGIGFSVGRWQLQEPSQDGELTIQDQIRLLRAEVGERLTRQMPEEAGSVARASSHHCLDQLCLCRKHLGGRSPVSHLAVFLHVYGKAVCVGLGWC